MIMWTNTAPGVNETNIGGFRIKVQETAGGHSVDCTRIGMEGALIASGHPEPLRKAVELVGEHSVVVARALAND